MKFRSRSARSSSRDLFFCATLLLTLAIPAALYSDTASFDLAGPHLEITVTQGGKTLPISNASSFQPGDRLWVRSDFPTTQSVHYVMVVAFLRGPTNPPPEDWFIRVETWSKQAREEGTIVTIPQGAQQALLFLAPETGGGFATLRSAVRARPGVFVRASQDLDDANLDRSRLEKYLSEVRAASASDPATLHERVALLAQTLRVKVDESCFDKPVAEQSSCLTRDPDELLLDDGHSRSIVDALTSGPSSDLVGALSTSPMARGGYYSPYVGAAVDFVRLMSNLRTAEFQYIPALASPEQSDVDLWLNAPPSFQNPKSVLVVGLPPVEAPQLPPLRPVDPKSVFCLEKSPLVLPAEGAPLAFSTAIGHDFMLRLQTKTGKAIDLPAKPDAARGGFVIETHGLRPNSFASEVSGTLHGYWGFKSYDGPVFQFRNSQSAPWTVPPSDAEALTTGREDTLRVDSGCAACVERVSVKDAKGKELNAPWKSLKPDELEVKIPLTDEAAGHVKLIVEQFGSSVPEVLTLPTYAEAARLDHFSINIGDQDGTLTGARLDEVSSIELNGVRFVPGKLSRDGQEEVLRLAVADTKATGALQSDQDVTAHVALKDGRQLDLATTVNPPRPKVTLVSKSVQPGSVPSGVHLGNENELPQDGLLSFFLKSEVPARFPRTEKIEVATTDGSLDAMLTVASGKLVLQDAESVLAILDPLKSFGVSGFGPLQFRAVAPTGEKGDWQPLANLVRIPSFKEVRCPDAPDQLCVLTGSSLFLLDSVASDSQFKDVVPVPAGYAATTLNVPRPNGTLLYIKLRDDPTTVDFVALPVLPEDH